MSRCVCCNKRLSSFELTRKNERGEYLDMCNECFNISGVKDLITVQERVDLAGIDDFEDEFEFEFSEEQDEL